MNYRGWAAVGTAAVLAGAAPPLMRYLRNGAGPMVTRYVNGPDKGKGITLLVPFRSDGDRRTRTWHWLYEYWRYWLPDAEIIEGHDENVPFSKTSAVNDAFRQSHGDIIVILDADCYIDAAVVLSCAAQIRAARRRKRKMWYVPYRHFFRLTDSASLLVLASWPQDPYRFSSPPPHDDTEESSGESVGHWYGALIQIMPREAFEVAGGMDERFCVDEETQILTRTGWKSRAELGEGESVLTLNHETGLSEWQPVLAVNSFDGEHQMLAIESKTHSSLTTMNHRWPVVHRPDYRSGTGWGSKVPTRTWTTSAGIKDSDDVPIAAVCADLPAVAKYVDDLVQSVAWFWTEGSITRLRDNRLGRGVVITQSLIVNPANCERIRACLTGAFGPASAFPRRGKSPVADIPRWHEHEDRGRNAVFALNAEAGDIMQQHAPLRVPSHEFLLALTGAQLDLFISASLLADGHKRTSGYEVSLTQKNPAAAEAFQFACILAGAATSIRTKPVMDEHGYGMTGVRIRQQRTFRLARGTHREVTLTGTVWCPTTPNGTWLARRNNSVYFTGNSGWGGEDVSFMLAVDTLYAPHHTTRNQVLHLWHNRIGTLHIEREWVGQTGPRANNSLANQYEGARGRPDRMRALTRGDGAGVLSAKDGQHDQLFSNGSSHRLFDRRARIESRFVYRRQPGSGSARHAARSGRSRASVGAGRVCAVVLPRFHHRRHGRLAGRR